jgi:flagellar protein FliO/FliZ
MWQNAWPALVLLALMVGIAWSLKWARGRVPGFPGLPGLPGQSGPFVKVLGSVSLGPQQRVVTLQVGQGDDATCLVLGVAPGSINTLHETALPSPATPAAPAAPLAGGFAARLAQQFVKGPGDAPR